MQGLVNRHKRNRKNSRQKFDGSLFWKKVLDRTTLCAGVLGPLMVIPQIYKIYSTHSASGVSALSWAAFAVLDIPFIIYGMLHKDKPIVTTYVLFCIANAIVAIGAILYR